MREQLIADAVGLGEILCLLGNGELVDPIAPGIVSGTAADSMQNVDNKGGRNGAYGPGFFSADLSLRYRVGLAGARRVEIVADIFNVTNRTNFLNPSGNSGTAATFLVLNAYSTSYAPRKMQIGARLQF